MEAFNYMVGLLSLSTISDTPIRIIHSFVGIIDKNQKTSEVLYSIIE